MRDGLIGKDGLTLCLRESVHGACQGLERVTVVNYGAELSQLPQDGSPGTCTLSITVGVYGLVTIRMRFIKLK